MSASSAAPVRRAPLLALWSRDDVRAAIVDYLPTETIAVLAVVAKPLRDAQSCLLLTAIKRRAKTTVPNPPTTRALLDALLVGEPHYFCETWERGMEQWRRHRDLPPEAASVHPYIDSAGSCLQISRSLHRHKGIFHVFRGENLRITRLRVTMGYSVCEKDEDGAWHAVGYASLCGPEATGSWDHEFEAHDTVSDFMGALRFSFHIQIVSLVWLRADLNMVGNRVVDKPIRLVGDAQSNTWYTVDAIFHLNSTFDISVDGQTVVQGLAFRHRPLTSLHLYNYTNGSSRFGDLEVWYERAAPNQVWAPAPQPDSP